jgi:Phosphotransferase enzyme family
MEANDLPAGTVEWLAEVGGGRITHLERHVARREAWVVDLERPDGMIRECFLRLERQPLENDPWSLGKETRIVAALADTAVPVPQVFARSERPSLTLFERVPGRADLPAVGAKQQRAVMTDFMGIVASLHVLDPETGSGRPATTSHGPRVRAGGGQSDRKPLAVLPRPLPRPAHQLRAPLAAS